MLGGLRDSVVPAFRQPPGAAGAGTPASGAHLRSARGWIRGGREYGVPVHHGSRRTARGAGSRLHHGCDGCLGQGVRDPGQDAATDRPDRRRPAVLLRPAQEARDERAGHRRPHGNLLWASSALPGAVHDIKAARTHGIIDTLAEAGLACRADKGYQGAQGGGLTDAERAVRERVRLDAAVRFESGDKNTVVAATLRVSERSVERWRREWREGGADGVASKGAPGRPRLSGAQVA